MGITSHLTLHYAPVPYTISSDMIEIKGRQWGCGWGLK